jgi:hypothetical protein
MTSSMLIRCAALVALPSILVAQEGARVAAPITVGANVQVSASFARRPHNEVTAAADPVHPGRMMACAMAYYEDRHLTAQHCYTSMDGASHWQPTLVIDSATVAGDPTIAYGFGDTVYAASLVNPLTIPRFTGEYRTHFYRSLDGGRTWSQSSDYRFIDREYIAVDRTGGKYHGRIYVNGQGSVRGLRDEREPGIFLMNSRDGGANFEGPAIRANMEGGGVGGAANVVILSDGTVATMFGNTKRGRTQDLTANNGDKSANATLEFVYSRDGGETFERSVTISQFYMDRPRSEGANIGQLAVDGTVGPFKDRLYAVWPDARSGRVEILLAHSADKGKTWSAPVVVNDDRSFADMEKQRDHILPAVTVNRNGVVAVTWYDRRESKDNLGWRIRIAASFDGGETFTPSVPVSTAANVYSADTPWPMEAYGMADSTANTVSLGFFIDRFFENGGHTTGLVADANGVFHPVWIDNRTGTAQIWTAPVTIPGQAVKNGAADLAGLDNLSKQVGVDLTDMSYDRKSGTLKATLRVENTSHDTIIGPLKVRVIKMTSDIGTPEIVRSDNGVSGVGAQWDLTSLLPAGGLMPDSLSRSRQITLHISDVQPMKSGRDYKNKAATIETRVFGKARPAPTTRAQK